MKHASLFRRFTHTNATEYERRCSDIFYSVETGVNWSDGRKNEQTLSRLVDVVFCAASSRRNCSARVFTLQLVHGKVTTNQQAAVTAEPPGEGVVSLMYRSNGRYRPIGPTVRDSHSFST